VRILGARGRIGRSTRLLLRRRLGIGLRPGRLRQHQGRHTQRQAARRNNLRRLHRITFLVHIALGCQIVFISTNGSIHHGSWHVFASNRSTDLLWPLDAFLPLPPASSRTVTRLTFSAAPWRSSFRCSSLTPALPPSPHRHPTPPPARPPGPPPGPPAPAPPPPPPPHLPPRPPPHCPPPPPPPPPAAGPPPPPGGEKPPRGRQPHLTRCREE